jgi:hypothetical protein
MKRANRKFLEIKISELITDLTGWYTEALDCKGLNNDEIQEEFFELVGDCKKLQFSSDCDETEFWGTFNSILDKYTSLLESRKKLTGRGRDEFRDSLTTAILCISHCSLLENYRREDDLKFVIEYLAGAYFSLGSLLGSVEERGQSGITTVVNKAVDIRHSFNRERKLGITEWYRKNKIKYKSKDDAAIEVASKFNLAFSTARKHLRGL